MSSSYEYKLHYFDGRGRAEAIRMIFVQADQKFQDIRYSFDEWKNVKSTMPLGQLPVLEYNGEQYPQSIAIARHVARKFHLAGKNDLESTKCDIIVDTMQEINEGYYRVKFHIKDENEKAIEEKKFYNELVPEKLTGLEKLMNKYGNGRWAVGDNVTWADFVIYDTLENVFGKNVQLLDNYLTLKKNREFVAQLPNIAAYLAKRAETPF